MPFALSVSVASKFPDTVNIALSSVSVGRVPVYVPPFAIESTFVALTTSIMSTSESDNFPVAVSAMFDSVKDSASLSPALTWISGASFVPVIVTVTVTVSVPPLPSSTVTSYSCVTVSPFARWSKAESFTLNSQVIFPVAPPVVCVSTKGVNVPR